MRTKKGTIHNRHRVNFSEQAENLIGMSDIILEILDARMIGESRLPEIEDEVLRQDKELIRVINKCDLLPREEIGKTNLPNSIFVSAKTRQGVNKLREMIKIAAKRFANRGRVHVGVVGYPNTGKSSLLNILARRGAAPTSSQPGFTKGIRKIRFIKGVLLIDAPGIVPRNENLFAENQTKHGLLGVKNPESVRNPDLVVLELMKSNPGKLERHYRIESGGDAEIFLEKLGDKMRFLKKGGEIDTERAARKALKDWHGGKIK